ncbi:phosphoribosyltransferase family protein [Robiginitalea sp. M366]|uniref:ComF family protein n=1 Tax=Robiginitalea aestuariiviva TaxID=3036903 RepID=UPI00240E1833|nr:phosphoribosyltransferase family protein [Robiginitalea aestuariiviva]MDG1571681.1 phosphoribosyltransferase family protein [Robiginitalea aestuariiviva]
MALLHYENGGLVQHLVHGLKYKGREGLGVTLGAWLGETLLRDPDTGNVDWVLPVPLHWRRRLKRGYNQCTGMARVVAEKLGAQTSERLLVRSRFSHTQTHRDRAGRWEGSRNTFRVRNPQRLEGCRILLVDDVITTGATLRACCQALEAVVGKEVLIATVAVVP